MHRISTAQHLKTLNLTSSPHILHLVQLPGCSIQRHNLCRPLSIVVSIENLVMVQVGCEVEVGQHGLSALVHPACQSHH
jgi:hypothetical protein